MKYLLEYHKYNKSTRTTNLQKEEFIDILKTNCKDWLNSPSQLVRFKKTAENEFSQIQPSKHNRKSLNHDNYVVMLMDNLPSWSKLPKRSHSIIFYNRNYYTDLYGNNLYFVIPFDNVKFGKAPSNDLWQSVNVNNTKFALDNRFSNALFNISAPIVYEEFYEYMNIEFIKSDFFDNKYTYSEFLELRQKFYDSSSKYENFMEFFNEYMSPENFKDIDDRSDSVGYKVVNYSNLTDTPFTSTKEVWTDGNCLIYSAGSVTNSYEVNRKFYEFLKSLNIKKQ